MPNLRWYLPTFHGDILLERKTEQTTILRVYELTTAEEKALEALRKRACHSPFLGHPWTTEKEFAPLSDPQYRTKDGLAITLAAPIGDVEAVLSKALNPKGRKLFSAVKFSNGEIEKIYGSTPSEPAKPDSYRINAKAVGDDPPPKDEKKKEPEAAATVKEPVIGCPVPEFPEADVRASRALEAFLDPRQLAEYRRHGAFVTVGRDTGHRYLVRNREAPRRLKSEQLKGFGLPAGGSFNGLYDLDECRPLCVHDWDVPPPEEMLALHLCLSLPGYEHHVRTLPHAF
jgi:hypothetical protein